MAGQARALSSMYHLPSIGFHGLASIVERLGREGAGGEEKLRSIPMWYGCGNCLRSPLCEGNNALHEDIVCWPCRTAREDRTMREREMYAGNGNQKFANLRHLTHDGVLEASRGLARRSKQQFFLQASL